MNKIAKDSRDVETRVCFGFPISRDDYPILLQIDELILENRKEKIKFGRSRKRGSSFYPKLNILIIRNIDKQRFDDFVEVWREKKGIFQGRTLEFKMDSLERTEDDLLLVHIKCPRWMAKARIEIAKSVQEFRTGAETQGKYGDKHWYRPLHFSIAFQISKEDFSNISDKFAREGFIGQELKFDSPVMYERAGEWDKEVELVYY